MNQRAVAEDAVVDLGEIELSLDDLEADELEPEELQPDEPDASEQALTGHVDDRGAVVVDSPEQDGARLASVTGSELDWSGLEFVDAVGVRREATAGWPGPELMDDDPRWAIDWGDAAPGAGTSDRAGPASRSPGASPIDSDDEWGIAPEIRRRADSTAADGPDPVETGTRRPVVEDEF